MKPEMGLQPELVSSNSFRVEHDPVIGEQEFTKNVESYLAEFRFQVQKYDYHLSLANQDGHLKLTDVHRNEPMTAKAHKAVLERKLRGEPAHREEAEFIGLTFLEQQLGEAQIGDSVIWFSPPGPESEGYGEYGFGFSGRVEAGQKGERHVKMTANRFEKPTLDQYNEAFSQLIGSGFNGQSADDFLIMPVVIKGGIPDNYIDLVFAQSFGFVFDPAERGRFDKVFSGIKPWVKELHGDYESLSPADRIKRIHALENFVAEAKKRGYTEIPAAERTFSTLANAALIYGYEPEKVAGSCPVKSNNPISTGRFGEVFGSGIMFKLPADEYGDREVLCPACGEISIRPIHKLLPACTNTECPDPKAIACDTNPTG